MRTFLHDKCNSWLCRKYTQWLRLDSTTAANRGGKTLRTCVCINPIWVHSYVHTHGQFQQITFAWIGLNWYLFISCLNKYVRNLIRKLSACNCHSVCVCARALIEQPGPASLLWQRERGTALSTIWPISNSSLFLNGFLHAGLLATENVISSWAPLLST